MKVVRRLLVGGVGTMLALSRDVFDHVPRAWWLTIPAGKMDFSETLTPGAERGCAEALELIQSLRLSFARKN